LQNAKAEAAVATAAQVQKIGAQLNILQSTVTAALAKVHAWVVRQRFVDSFAGVRREKKVVVSRLQRPWSASLLGLCHLFVCQSDTERNGTWK
jgi:hypothetical protein